MTRDPAKTTISVPGNTKAADTTVLQGISWYPSDFHSHHDVAKALTGKHPYAVTILIENLNPKLCNRKEYVKKTKIPMRSKYRELLLDMFDAEYGHIGGNQLYGQWLEQYRPLFNQEQRINDLNIVDNYIEKHELEPRYKQKILARFKNHTKLFQERHYIERERYYDLPEPLNRVDWRNPFDNIFVWEEDGHKVAGRGGSGSSGRREANSKFVFGLLELNKTQPVPSYLFVYSENNELIFVKEFDSLCIPDLDVGSNYHQISHEEADQLKQGGHFLRWEWIEGISKVEVVRDKATFWI